MNKRQKEHNPPSLSWQVRQALLKTVQTYVPLDIQSRCLDAEKAWDILIYASVTGSSIENACNTLADVPSGNTVREHLNRTFSRSRFEVLALEEELNEALRSQLPKRVFRLLPLQTFEIGIDLTELPYHGQLDQDCTEICRSQAKSGTTHFHTYATLAIVHRKKRYEVALTFVWSDESLEKVVQRLVRQAIGMGLFIRRAYLDKGFCCREVFEVLQWHRIPYLIPIPKRGKTGGINALFQGRKSYRTTHTFYPDTQEAYTIDVILIRRKVKGHYVWVAFACYRVDHIPLSRIFDLYRCRFGMESGYRLMQQTKAQTTSRNPVLRLLLVGLALMIYNVFITVRQICYTNRCYGTRTRRVWLTLKRLTGFMQKAIEGCWDIKPLLCTHTRLTCF